MRIGISASPLGGLATSASLRALAAAAEQVGYAAVWAADDPGSPGSVRDRLDPLTVAATAAAATSTIQLGVVTCIGASDASSLRASAPATGSLVRSLSSLDVVSDGRLLVSLGATPAGRRALAHTVETLARHWLPPCPPVLVAAPGAWGRELAAAWADGWHAIGPPLGELAAEWSDVRRRAALHGRDPAGLRLVVWAPVVLTDGHLPAGRALYSGSVDQVADDVAATESAGAHEIVLSLGGSHELDTTLDVYARIAETVGLRGGAG